MVSPAEEMIRPDLSRHSALSYKAKKQGGPGSSQLTRCTPAFSFTANRNLRGPCMTASELPPGRVVG